MTVAAQAATELGLRPALPFSTAGRGARRPEALSGRAEGRLQFELNFGTPGGDVPPAPPPATPGSGLLTGRAWQRAPLPSAATLARLRRVVPLACPVSDHLLALLAARGLTDPQQLEQFFFPSLDHLPEPFLLEEMDAAADRLLAAAAGEERVAVHGDFDVDGLTGCALLTLLLQRLTVAGRRASLEPPFVPDRLVDGYGVCGRQIQVWGRRGVRLLLTVDTGAAARQELALAAQLGLETVVLDHHLFRTRPQAVAVVNPRRPQTRYPNPDLCGVAVAWKLAQALHRRAPAALPASFLEEVLDLVALGLIADQMPLTGENRVLVVKGLERLRRAEAIRPGLAQLLRVAGFDSGFPVTAANLAYQVAPRLNACGRVGDVAVALELLLATDPERARELALLADSTNAQRRRTDQTVKEQAIAQAAPFVARGDPGLVLASPEWHKGVIGISAARLVELYGVPAVLIAVEGDEARGSARSVPGVDLKAALDRCAGLLVRYGGHAQAAGLTLRTEDLEAFRAAFLAAVAAAPGGGPVTEPYDLELSLAAMTAGEVAALVAELEQLEPFGQGHREPVFRCDGLRLAGEPQRLRGGHLRFSFRGPGAPPAGGGPALLREFVAFGSQEAWDQAAGAAGGGAWWAGMRWNILFRLGRNHYRPRNGGEIDPVQQQLVDLHPAETS